MDRETQISVASLHLIGVGELHKHWGWFVGLSIQLVVLGMMALGSSVVMTLATMVFVGWLMIGGGVVPAVYALTCKGWSGFFLDLLCNRWSLVMLGLAAKNLPTSEGKA